MTYDSREARQHLLDTIAEATVEIGAALAALTDAYEQLDEASADRLEDELFRPVQTAFGRIRKTHTEFAGRHGLPAREFAPAGRGAPSRGVKGFVEAAADAIDEAELILSELQDSMMPVEVGDAELRAGLADVRGHLAEVGERAARFVSRFGR